MPTYQYACTECDNAFDLVQSFSDDSLTVCPRCEGKLRKIFNAVGVVFKGSGFYRTDNRAEAKSSGDSEKKTNKKGETESGGTTSTESTAKPVESAAKPVESAATSAA